jgi:hypothetical protein
MVVERVIRLRHIARAAYSRHPAARLYRAWRYVAGDPSGRAEHCLADILLLPLAGLMLTLWVLETVPGAGEAIGTACSAACMP